jgi:hypothetical protein
MPLSLSRNRTDRIGSGHGKSNKINEMEATTRNRLWFSRPLDTSGWGHARMKKGAEDRPFGRGTNALQDE